MNIFKNLKDAKTTVAGIIVALLTFIGQIDDIPIVAKFHPVLVVAGSILALVLIFCSFSSFTANFDTIKDIFQRDDKNGSDDNAQGNISSQKQSGNTPFQGDVLAKTRKSWHISIFGRKSKDANHAKP